MHKPTLTIGIPAYNEQANIKHLLRSLLLQVQDTFVLDKIIVISDGSIDATVAEAESLRDGHIQVLAHSDRQGVAFCQTEIFKLAVSDIVVLIDADILPKNNIFLEEIIKPFRTKENIGIVGAKVSPLLPTSFFESLLVFSEKIKNYMFLEVRDRTEVFLCHGRARAFSKEFYKGFRFPQIMNEDSYSYLYAIENGFKFYFAPDAEILFRLPRNIKDYLKQSHRFLNAKEEVSRYISKDKVEKAFAIPFSVKVKAVIKFFAKNPVYLFGYMVVYLISVVTGIFKDKSTVQWQEVISTKLLT